MGNSLTKAAVAAVLVVLIGGSWAPADEVKPEKAPAKSDSSALTGSELVKILEGLGYEPKVYKDKKGEVYGGYIKYPGTAYTYYPDITLSPNKQWVWLSFGLNPLPSAKVPADKARQLLSVNDTIGPCSFTYDKANNKFRLKIPIYNRGIKPVILKDMLELANANLTANVSTWDPNKWMAAKPKKDKDEGKDKKE